MIPSLKILAKFLFARALFTVEKIYLDRCNTKMLQTVGGISKHIHTYICMYVSFRSRNTVKIGPSLFPLSFLISFCQTASVYQPKKLCRVNKYLLQQTGYCKPCAGFIGRLMILPSPIRFHRRPPTPTPSTFMASCA